MVPKKYKKIPDSTSDILQVTQNADYRNRLRKAITTEFFPLLSGEITVSDKTAESVGEDPGEEPINSVVAKYIPEDSHEFNQMVVRDNMARRRRHGWAFGGVSKVEKQGEKSGTRALVKNVKNVQVSTNDDADKTSKTVGAIEASQTASSLTAAAAFSKGWPSRPDPRLSITSTKGWKSAANRPQRKGHVLTENTRLSSDPLRLLAIGESVTSEDFLGVKPSKRAMTYEKQYDPVPLRDPYEIERKVRK
ncbi:unnamed protein product [Kuraishia capsulata CBS 1993]|uniref:Uncharacterized protein n=1 Tax=Kuraishia capsulata CBS 1993 TaxID=1382522 RepID=W6MV09_9ASCO|nr:uncharacterized protein KUCA_T00001971001 [Kuraishia capsulata CBS 1993]CDK26000.1 unnamed protein product [Kuraishia capsulata CBS 1993]